jgi:hypothetical protein
VKPTLQAAQTGGFGLISRFSFCERFFSFWKGFYAKERPDKSGQKSL